MGLKFGLRLANNLPKEFSRKISENDFGNCRILLTTWPICKINKTFCLAVASEHLILGSAGAALGAGEEGFILLQLQHWLSLKRM